MKPGVEHRTALAVCGATAFTCFLSPAWSAVAAPALLLLLAASPGVGRERVIGHYLWPILPWLFAAAVIGVQPAGP